MRHETPTAEEDFVSDYVYFTEALLGADGSDAETALIARHLPPPRARVADVGCGYGRISRRLARAGYDVVGIDIDRLMLRRARDWAGREGEAVAYVHADARTARIDGGADAAVCWFTTFGMLEEDEGRKLLRNVHAMLRPGGVFLIDVVDKDQTLRSLETWSVVEVNESFLIEHHTFDAATNRLHGKQTIIRGGTRRYEFAVRLYDREELTAELARARFIRIESMEAMPGRLQLACAKR